MPRPASTRASAVATFTTDRFNATVVGPHFINPCCFGEDCAAWLAARLRAGGAHVDGPWQEDWGWQAGVRTAGGPVLLSVRFIDETAGPEWRVALDAVRPLGARLRALVGRPRGAQADDVAALAAVVDAILRADTSLRDVRWKGHAPARPAPTAGA